MNELSILKLYDVKRKYSHHVESLLKIKTKRMPPQDYARQNLLNSNILSHQRAFNFKLKQEIAALNKQNKMDRDKLKAKGKKIMKGTPKVDSLNVSKYSSHSRQSSRLDLENRRYESRVTSVRSTINTRKMEANFEQHCARVKQLSRFTMPPVKSLGSMGLKPKNEQGLKSLRSSSTLSKQVQLESLLIWGNEEKMKRNNRKWGLKSKG